jgi:hypothetical protein
VRTGPSQGAGRQCTKPIKISAGTPALKEHHVGAAFGAFYLFLPVVVLKTTDIEKNPLKPAGTARLPPRRGKGVQVLIG